MSKGNIKFSIVCPVYNSESFLTDCIDSVIQQKHENWELILVNDGSTDNSLQICSFFAEKDKRIVLINQNNTGQFVARLNAINNATGDYILFLDSDDKLFDNALDILSLTLSNNKTDIVWFSYSYDIAHIKNPFYLHDRDVTKFGNPLEELFAKRIGFFLWDKCFKTDLFKDLHTEMAFEFKNFAEDTLLVYLISSNSKSIQIINEKLYFYRFNENSTVRKISRTDQKGRDYIYSYIYANVSKKLEVEKSVFDIYLQKYLDLVLKVVLYSKRKRYYKEIKQIYHNFNGAFHFRLKTYLKSKKQRFVFTLYNKKMFLSSRLFAMLMLRGSFN